MEYETIELEIGSGDGREYPITVRSLAGEAHDIMRFPFDEIALENRLVNLQNTLLRSGGQRRQFFSTEQETVQKFGQDLFNALMTSEIRLYYEKSEDRAQQEGKGLRIQLRIQPPEIATLPWEFMYDAEHATYLALSPRTPIIRYLALPRSIDPLTIEPPLRILGMIASPQGVQPLDIHREKERLERAVDSLQQRGLLELTWVQGETWRDLQQALRNARWHIFHFVGHGGFDPLTDEGFIVLTDKQQQPHLLPATQLAELLTGYYPPRLVLLNACDGAQSSKRDIFSSTASILLRHGIPAVVAMQYEITDRAAIEFSGSFYEAIATGLSIETAIAEARKAIWISISNTFEWGTPVLYTHAPDGVLFNIQYRNAELVTPQPTITASEQRPEAPQDLNTLPSEQKTLKTETEVKAEQSSPPIIAPVKAEEAKKNRDKSGQTQVLQAAPTQNPVSTASIPPLIIPIPKIRFFRQWLLASTLSCAVGAAVGGGVDIGLGVVVAVVTCVFTLWFVLHRSKHLDYGWMLIKALGRFLFWAVVIYIALVIAGLAGVAGQAVGSAGVVVGTVVGVAAAVAFLRFIYLKFRYISIDYWFIGANILGLSIGPTVGSAVFGALTGNLAGTIGGALAGAISGALAGAIGGAIYAVITIFSLFGLLQRSTSNQTAA